MSGIIFLLLLLKFLIVFLLVFVHLLLPILAVLPVLDLYFRSCRTLADQFLCNDGTLVRLFMDEQDLELKVAVGAERIFNGVDLDVFRESEVPLDPSLRHLGPVVSYLGVVEGGNL